MFERFFKAAMICDPRVLFSAAMLMAAAGVLQIFFLVQQMNDMPLAQRLGSLVIGMLSSAFAPAACLLFGALLIDRADRLLRRLRT